MSSYPDQIDQLELFSPGEVIRAARVNELQDAITRYERANLNPWSPGIQPVTSTLQGVQAPWLFFVYSATLTVPVTSGNYSVVDHRIPKSAVPEWVQSNNFFLNTHWYIWARWYSAFVRPFSVSILNAAQGVIRIAAMNDRSYTHLMTHPTDLEVRVLFAGT